MSDQTSIKIFLSLLFISFLLYADSAYTDELPPAVSVSKISFKVENLKEYATVYCPQTASEKNKKYPLVFVMHGGFWGDDAGTDEFGERLAQNGYCAIAPTYRGEKRRADKKKSEGEVEYCAGEVDDVMTLIDEMKRKSQYDTSALSLVGFSHGGCIAMRVAEKRDDIRSVVLFAAPVDAIFLYENLTKHWGKNFLFNGWLAAKLRKSVGSTPDKDLKAWQERSPILSLNHFHSSLLFIHGLTDNIVPVEQTYHLRDQLKKRGEKVTEKIYSKKGEVIKGEKDSSNAKYQFLFFEKQGHVFDKSIHSLTEDLAIEFIQQQMK